MLQAYYNNILNLYTENELRLNARAKRTISSYKSSVIIKASALFNN